MTPVEYCEQKVRPYGSTFYYSSLFLPLHKRQAVTALYAYCRELADVVDECQEPAVAHMKFEWWRQETLSTFQGMPSHPVCQALSSAIDLYGLSKSDLFELIDGIEMNLAQRHYNTFDELNMYCKRVGAVAGGLSASILGYTESATLEYARQLGAAFQLTEIIFGVGQDARHDRLYIPIEDLKHFDVAQNNILDGVETNNFRSLMAFETERVERCYTRAFEFLPEDDRLRQLPGLIMAAIYRATLDEIRQDGYQVLTHNITLPPLRKLWIAWRTRRTEKRRSKSFGRH